MSAFARRHCLVMILALVAGIVGAPRAWAQPPAPAKP